MTFRLYSYSTNMEPLEQLKTVRTLSSHCLSLVIKGEVHLSWGEYKDVVARAGEMYFLPRGAEVSGYVVGETEIVVSIIGRGMTGKELKDLRDMKKHERFQKYEFKPMAMNPPMMRLAESIKETFSVTPRKWIDEHTRQVIIGKASEPNVAVKDLMYEVGVYNPSQFTKLCKRLCGVTPSQLIKP